MEENPKPRRRWFRFSLLGMVVLVTLVCVYLGWAMNWKRQRDAVLFRTAFEYSNTGLLPHHRYMGREGRAPLLLRPIGAVGVTCLAVSAHAPDEELNRIRALFPEAEVERIDY